MTDDTREPPAMVPSAEERAQEFHDWVQRWCWRYSTTPGHIHSSDLLEYARAAAYRDFRDGWNARAALDAPPTTKFGDPAPRSFNNELPGPGWSVSEETHLGLLRLEQSRRDAVARLGGHWKDPEIQVAEAVRRAASAPTQPGDAERRRRLLRIQGFVDSFADKHAARNAVSALDAQFLLDELDAAQSALAECREDRDHYRARAYELGDAEGKLQDELAAAQAGVREATNIGNEAIDFAHGWIAGLPVTPSFEDKHAAQAALEVARDKLRALAAPEPHEEKRDG